MKITQIMLGKGFGGAERSFVDLSLALAGRGHLVQAVHHRGFTARRLLEGVANLHPEPVAPRGRWDVPATRRIRQAIQAFAPDVMHAHLARAAWTGGRAKQHGLPPLVAKTHNYVNLKYYRDVDQFIATTASQVDYLTAHGVDRARVQQIPNFSALQPAARARVPTAGEQVHFIGFGRFVPKKGFAELLQAFRHVLVDLPDARLTLAGSGSEERRLRDLVDELGLAGHVCLPGWVDDVQALLGTGNAFVLPSFDEPFGIAVIEAMAAGLPIVSTRTHGPNEILDADTALLVDPGDTEQLSSAMLTLCRQPDAALARAETALERYRNSYHGDAVVPQIEDVYRALTKS